MEGQRQRRAVAHHKVPQFYLRSWANAAGAVATMTRDGREFMAGTRSLAVENDFYTLTRPEGEKTSMIEEGLLKEWDTKASVIHARIIRGEFPLSDDDRVTYGLWIGLQWLRGSVARQVKQEFHDVFNKLMIQVGLDVAPRLLAEDSPRMAGAHPEALGAVEVPRLDHLPEHVKDVLRRTDEYKFELSQEEAVLSMVGGVPGASEPFLEADWILTPTPNLDLLTSDEPISLFRVPTLQNEHFGLGPANADMMHLPLTPGLCLVMRRSPATGIDLKLESGPPDTVEAVNGLTLHQPWRQLYRHPDGSDFPKLPPAPPERFVTGG